MWCNPVPRADEAEARRSLSAYSDECAWERWVVGVMGFLDTCQTKKRCPQTFTTGPECHISYQTQRLFIRWFSKKTKPAWSEMKTQWGELKSSFFFSII